MSFPPGITSAVLSGKYRVIRTLEERDGVVRLLGEHESIQREVEIKLLVTRSPEVEARLFREARALGSVSSASTRSVLDSGVDPDGRPFVVYEALHGPTLAEILKAHAGGLPALRAASIAMQVLEALRALHRHGVVVRGLAPEHVVVVDGPNGEVAKLAQLERAVFLGEQVPPEPVRFSPWIAPEIRRAEGVIDVRSDVYSAGMMLRHVLTGRVQDEGGLPDTAARAVARAAAEDPEERFPSVEVLMQCVALLLPTPKRVARDHMPIPTDPLAADLHYLALRRSTRHGTLELPATSESKLHLLLVLVTVEAIYRRLGPELWGQLVEAIPSVEEVLPGSGRTSEHLRAGVPVGLVAEILEKADALAGRNDLELLSELSAAIAQRALRRLCPDLPAALTPQVIVDAFPYVWSRIAREGTGIVVDRTSTSAKLAIEGHAPSLEITGLTAGIVRGALRESGAPDADVSIVACSALGDLRDVFVLRWGR